MKKVLFLLCVLAMTGIASAEMLNNPETFNGYADGTVLWDSINGLPVDGWEGWGSGNTGVAWAQWTGTNAGNVVQGGQVLSQSPTVPDPLGNGVAYSYNLLFNHGNQIGSLPAPAVAGTAELTFDVLAINVGGIAKIEYFDGTNTKIGEDIWDPYDMSALGTFTFVGTVPVGTATITPVVGVTGVGGYGLFDNISLAASVPEPATMALLGLGGLFLRRRK